MQDCQNIVKTKGVCFACLKSGHCATHCRIWPKCAKCEQGHHAIMCNPGLSEKGSMNNHKNSGPISSKNTT